MKRIEVATAQDNAGNYKEALELYKSALDAFMKALECMNSIADNTYTVVEQNPEIKEAIKQKITQYMARAELVKEVVEMKEKEQKLEKKKLEVSAAASRRVLTELQY